MLHWRLRLDAPFAVSPEPISKLEQSLFERYSRARAQPIGDYTPHSANAPIDDAYRLSRPHGTTLVGYPVARVNLTQTFMSPKSLGTTGASSGGLGPQLWGGANLASRTSSLEGVAASICLF